MSGAAPPYDAAYYHAREGWGDRQVESREAVRHLRQLPGSLTLDIGCGSGPLFPVLRAHGLTPVGVETNRLAACAAAARGLGGVVEVGPAVALPFRSAVAGGIIAQHLIEHLDAPGAAAQEWWRLLRPGGRLVILTPNGEHPDPAIFADPDHRPLFTACSLARLLRKAGFQEVRVDGLFPYCGRSRVGRACSRRLWRAGRVPLLRRRARTLLAVALKAP